VISGGRAIPTAQAQLQAQAAQAAVPVTAQPSTVFVELGEASQQANIARNGVAVPVLTLNPAVLQTQLGLTTKVVAKVVSQSIQAGVSVAKGTTIDLVLAEPTSLKVSVLENAFVPLQDQTNRTHCRCLGQAPAACEELLGPPCRMAAPRLQDRGDYRRRRPGRATVWTPRLIRQRAHPTRLVSRHPLVTCLAADPVPATQRRHAVAALQVLSYESHPLVHR